MKISQFFVVKITNVLNFLAVNSVCIFVFMNITDFIKESLVSGSRQSSTRVVFYAVAISGIAFIMGLMVAMLIDVCKDGHLDMSLLETAALFPAVGAYIYMGAQPKAQSDRSFGDKS